MKFARPAVTEITKEQPARNSIHNAVHSCHIKLECWNFAPVRQLKHFDVFENASNQTFATRADRPILWPCRYHIFVPTGARMGSTDVVTEIFPDGCRFFTLCG